MTIVRTRRLALIVLTGALLACPEWGIGGGAASYTVRPGDRLQTIAGAFGVTVGDLESSNGLGSAGLKAGQRLTIPEPLRLVKAPTLRWHRPLAKRPGRVLREFMPHPAKRDRQAPHTGADVAVPAGSDVLCPANGVVLYCGQQSGFGTVVILDHGAGFSTVLAPVVPDTAICRPGEAVRKGDVLGRTGAPVEIAKPYLHVELRRGLQPVSPQPLLR